MSLPNEIQFPPAVIARGHFQYESGHHGDLWLQLDNLFVDAKCLNNWAARLAEQAAFCSPQIICGALTGGAFVAQLLAVHLDAEFVFCERHVSSGGNVQYSVPQVLRSTLHGKRCLLVDDVINAGSALRGVLADVQRCEGAVVGIASLMVLGEAALKIADAQGVPLFTLSTLERSMWSPDEYPLCKRGLPLTKF